jgi:uncharacterized protein YrrD
MLKGREILSLPVVTLKDRTQIGEVKDLIYDHSINKIIGYLIEPGGWLRDGKGFLHIDLVRLEDDCLVVNDESVVKKLSTIPELKEIQNNKNDLRGLRVEHEDGHIIGVIQDLVVDGETGEILGYEVSDGIIQDLLDGRATISTKVISVNEDKVVASPAAADDDTLAKGELL